MEENELETILLHLGQDIGYMGLRLQKDVQKCIKELKITHDNKTFCEKLANVLKKFSEYTGQYAKDLDSRVKGMFMLLIHFCYLKYFLKKG